MKRLIAIKSHRLAEHFLTAVVRQSCQSFSENYLIVIELLLSFRADLQDIINFNAFKQLLKMYLITSSDPNNMYSVPLLLLTYNESNIGTAAPRRSDWLRAVREGWLGWRAATGDSSTDDWYEDSPL